MKSVVKSEYKTINQRITEAYKKRRELAYHCTNVSPEVIQREGFKAGKGGYTINNNVDWLYQRFLPRNPMFVSSKDAKVWDPSAKFCIEIDVSGLELFPDFGHLLDFQAEFDEDYVFWRDDDLVALETMVKQGNNTAKYVLDWVRDLDDYTLPVENFTWCESWDILGTAAVDGDKFVWDKMVVQVIESNT